MKRKIFILNNNLRGLWDISTMLTIPLYGSRSRKGENLLKEIITKNIPNLGKEIDIKIQEAQRVPSKEKSKEHHTKTHYI